MEAGRSIYLLTCCWCISESWGGFLFSFGIVWKPFGCRYPRLGHESVTSLLWSTDIDIAPLDTPTPATVFQSCCLMLRFGHSFWWYPSHLWCHWTWSIPFFPDFFVFCRHNWTLHANNIYSHKRFLSQTSCCHTLSSFFSLNGPVSPGTGDEGSGSVAFNNYCAHQPRTRDFIHSTKYPKSLSSIFQNEVV